ncbi:MAG: GatB/YqeY domain-containing protein [candidate division NC10 bacterium]|nr:GatB/YqeY domain-containing protein [candidate division NC10 bacterium]
MGDLRSQLNDDLKSALRSGDKLRLSVVRLLSAVIKNREVEKRGPLSDAEVLQAIVASCKQRQESIEQFQQGGRADLVEKESAELSILRSYLPTPLTGEELRALIGQTIRDVQAASPKDMGKVMAALMPKVTGRADGKAVSALVREMLAAT